MWPSSLIAGLASILFLYQAIAWLTRKFKKSKIDQKLRARFDQQSIVLPGPERIHVSILADGTDYLINLDPNVTTLYENFLRGMKISNDGECLGHRKAGEPFKWYKYGEILAQAHQFGSGLMELGLELGPRSFVGIYGQNRPEWVISSLACVSYSSVVVPLYDTLGLDAVHFIVRQAELEIVVCDSFEKAQKLILANGRLKHIVFMRGIDCVDRSLREKASDAGIRLHGFDDVVALGKNRRELRPPKPDDLYMICYTSGTTGNPKGVMLTHRNVICNASACTKTFEAFGMKLHPGESVISYLPLAHMFEQMVQVLLFFHGGKVGIFQGDINSLVDDMKALEPNYLPAVPRLLNRFYDKIESTLAGNLLKRTLFNLGLRAKLADLKRGEVSRDSFWDKLIFNKIQSQLGGRIRFIVTGSAPIRDEVLSGMRAMLGCQILEAYGQTEGTAASTCTFPFDFTSGHVGGPMAACHVKLVDAPELDYFAKNDEGEICIRGPSVTSGYFRDPERTKEILDEDGWLHTGDVGRWLPNGALKIIDRKKHIFKLAQGEYVAPEKIENVYARSPLVAQIFVDGNSLQRFLVAVVVPDESHLRQLVRTNGQDLAALCSNADVRRLFLSDLTKIGRKLGLNSLELVKALHLAPEPFTVANGLLTPTMKLKRPQLRKQFHAVIEDLYKSEQH